MAPAVSGYWAAMHRSRLAAIGIDCPSDSALQTARFWSGALVPDASPPEAFVPDYPYLGVGEVAGREVFVQQVDDAARVHLDIETDDVAAEVARVVALGAGVVEDRGDYAILRDPGSLVFCVVPVQTGELFEREARSWP
jgi:hypothetical protein